VISEDCNKQKPIYHTRRSVTIHYDALRPEKRVHNSSAFGEHGLGSCFKSEKYFRLTLHGKYSFLAQNLLLLVIQNIVVPKERISVLNSSVIMGYSEPSHLLSFSILGSHRGFKPF